ncbi:hypothetical protein FZCC0188_11575 [Rhodobacterales bacterium FZCC0188]|nr:hypothetical protein [Rhodobacterales bacterium FZCC0188]
MILLGASLITMDHLNFERDISMLEKNGGIDYLHVDIMDGHYVPRYGIYPEIMQEIAQRTKLPMDVHLMVSDIEFALTQISDIPKISTVSFHLFQNEGRVYKIIDQIRKFGARPVLALDLSTSVNHVYDILRAGELEGLLFMGIHPGVLIQKHRPNQVIQTLTTLNKIMDFDENFILQIDGGFNFDTGRDLALAGINSFVGGTSTIFKNAPPSLQRDQRIENIKRNISMVKGLINLVDQ